MNIPQKYNQSFIDHLRQHKKATHDAQKYGVNIMPVPDLTQSHWRVIGVHHLTGEENHGQHHVFCEVLDENGQRLNGTNINILTNGSPRGTMTIDKPGNEPGTNTHMHFGDTLTIFIEREGLPSEQVAGLHTRHDDEEAGTTRGHHSFYVVFQRSPGLAAASSKPETNGAGMTVLSEKEVAAAVRGAGEGLVIPLNRQGALFKAAQANQLGEHLTDEYETIVAGQNYTGQIFEGGLVYARTGQWDKIAVAPSARTRGLAGGPEVQWTQEITGFRGNRWNYWEQNLVGKIPGYSWQMFSEECLLNNPQLAQDGFIFRPDKRYKMPKVDGQPQKPAQGQPAGPTATPTPAAPKAPPADFVQVKNGQFQVKGKVSRFIGANIRGLVHYGQIPQDLPHTHIEQQAKQLQEAAIMNVRVVRVFLAHKSTPAIQVEARLRQLLALMRQNFPNIYLLPALTNLYHDVPFYVQGDDKFFGNGILNNDFYGGGYRENYLPFVKHIVNAFKNEPQIFAWEIGNELKAEQAPELLVDFMLDMARQINGWDPNHLVTTGMISTRHAWMASRPDLREKLYSSPHLDFITIHAYDGNEKPDAEKEDDSDLAQRFKKPFIIEEAGFNKQKYPNRPEKTRQDMTNWFGRGASCYMPWGFMATDFDNGDSDNVVGMGKQLPDWREMFELHRQCGELTLNHDVNDSQGLSQKIASLNFTPRRAMPVALPWPMLADGFDFPVGRPNSQGYYVAAGLVDEAYFKERGFWHTGEDWNGQSGGDKDLGAPVYTIGNGLVITAQYFPIWGNVVLLEHRLPWGQTIWSQYAHLRDCYVKKGDVLRRGDELGTIGKGDKDQFVAHLHFEVRVKNLPASKWWGKTPADREKVLQNYVNPTYFINANRPK